MSGTPAGGSTHCRHWRVETALAGNRVFGGNGRDVEAVFCDGMFFADVAVLVDGKCFRNLAHVEVLAAIAPMNATYIFNRSWLRYLARAKAVNATNQWTHGAPSRVASEV